MQLLLELRHHEINKFAKDYLKRKNRATRGYQIVNILVLAVAGFVIGQGIAQGSFDGINVLLLISVAFISLFMVLIPIHELIHAAAFKYFGASSIRIRVIWKKLAFMTSAPDFMIAAKPFAVVALAPLVVINSLLLAGVFLLPFAWSFVCALLLVFHTLACGGDLALLSFYEEHKDKEIWTKDLQEEDVSYFYVKD